MNFDVLCVSFKIGPKILGMIPILRRKEVNKTMNNFGGENTEEKSEKKVRKYKIHKSKYQWIFFLKCRISDTMLATRVMLLWRSCIEEQHELGHYWP